METKYKVLRGGGLFFFLASLLLHALGVYFGVLCLNAVFSSAATGESVLDLTFGLVYYVLFCGLGLISSFISFVLFRVGPNKDIKYCKVLNIIQSIIDVLAALIFVVILAYSYIVS